MARSFYEDDGEFVAKPGAPTTVISDDLKKQESAHGNVSFIGGMAVRTTPYLEKFVNKFRLLAHDKLSIIEAEVGNTTSALNNEAATLAHEVQATIKEPLLPGLIYILTTSLTGSIIARNRSLPLRFAVPTTFGVVATSQFMPKTYDSIVERYNDWEKKNASELHSKKHELKQSAQLQTAALQESLREAKLELQRNVHNARVFLADLLD